MTLGAALVEAPVDDAVLCRRASAGDDAAFGELCRRHTPALLRMVRSAGLGAEDASDVVQDALCRVLEKRHFLASVTKVRGWLYRVALNIAYSRGRKGTRQAAILGEHEAEAPGMSQRGEDAEKAAQWARVAGVLDVLSPKQRDVLLLRVGDLSFAEVAKALGTSENACKVHFHNAVQRLKATLAEQEQP